MDDKVIKAQVIVCRVVRSIGRPGFVDASHCLVDPSSQPQSETPCPLIDLVSEREGGRYNALAHTNQRRALYHGVRLRNNNEEVKQCCHDCH